MEKERLNLYIGTELLKRLEKCADSYGVSRTQLAVTLIGQGVASIEKAFQLVENLPPEILDNNN